MLPIINIGPMAIQTTGLIIVIGIWLSMIITEKNSPKYKLDPQQLESILMWSLAAIIVFARVGYIARYPSIFFEYPLSMLSINLQLFDFQSGFILGVIFFVVLIRRKKLTLNSVLNAMTPGLIIFGMFYFLSLFAAGKYFGLLSDLPWAIEVWGVRRHPLQLYYVVAAGLLLVKVFSQLEKKNINQRLFWETARLFSIIVIILDFLRGDQKLLLGPVHILQLLALLLLISSMWMIQRQKIPIMAFQIDADNS